eukprot:g8162.t1
MVVQVGAPIWEDGLACPFIAVDGLAPARQARELVSRFAASLACAGGPRGLVSPGLVDQVFALVQLALDDRSPPPAAGDGANHNSRDAEKAFRSALAPGALGLLPKLTAALQPRQEGGVECNGGNIDTAAHGKGNVGEQSGGAQSGGPQSGGELRDAVVLAATHFTAMEQLVARQNNTPALLMAHNGLAKLLKNNWPCLIGGVVDAPRLLSRLCEIYRDGLDQLTVAVAQADAKRVALVASANGNTRSASEGEGAAEIAHLKKFGKLLATFGTRMACLLRHLGQECSRRDRREAYRLYAKAAAAVYPGLVASPRENVGVDGAPAGGPAGAALSGSVAGEIIYPKAVEAFLSTTDRPPCFESPGDRIPTAAAATATMETNSTRISSRSSSGSSHQAQTSCRCYEGMAGALSGWSHDPRQALEALRPATRSPLPPQLRRTDPTPEKSSRVGHSGDGSAAAGLSGHGGADDSDSGGGEPATATATAVDPLGAVLLLCEVLRGGDRVSAAGAVGPTLQRECCGWVLDHLAALFPGWVETASCAGDAVDVGRSSGQGVALALCDEVATALGLFVCHRALTGEFEEAQVQLIEGCACHPHPVCREAWIGALKVFLARCDPAAQWVCVQSLTDAALDPRVSRRCRRRLGRALSVVCAAIAVVDTPASSSSCSPALLAPAARAALVRSCLSRLRDGSSGGGSNSSSSSSSDDGDVSSGACVLDLLRSLLPPWRSSSWVVGDGSGSGSGGGGLGSGAEELATASVSFARSVLTAGFMHARGGEGEHEDVVRLCHTEENIAAAAMFLAAGSKPAPEPDSDGVGGGLGRRGGNQDRAPAGAELEVEEAAREAGEKLGGMLSAGHSGHLLSAIARLLSKTNPDRLPKLCALIAAEARDGRVGGEALLALAEALTWMGRPLPLKQQPENNSVWKSVFQDGFTVLFGSRLWPVTTAAMQALEAVATCVDPGIAELLPRLVPKDLLTVFKSRIARRMVYSERGRPLEVDVVRKRGLKETEILTAAAAAFAERGKSKHASAGQPREVMLKEGSDLSELTSLLGWTVGAVRLLSDQEGGGVCLTLRDTLRETEETDYTI